MKKLTVIILCFALCQCSSDGREDDRPTNTGYVPTATTVPSTDIFVARMGLGGSEGVTLTDWRNVTDRDGYDNQPQFTNDGAALLFASVRDGRQTDVYSYELATEQTMRVTETTESEFSPTPMRDSEAFSAIRETPEAQWLWQYGLNGESRGILLPTVTPIGYHAWGNAHVVGFFLLGSRETPATLQVVDIRDQVLHQVASEIGRSLHKIPGTEAISYVDKTTDDWTIRSYRWEDESTGTVVATLPGSEDYAWAPDGTIFMGRGSELFRWVGTGDWVLVADLLEIGVAGISRIAISPNGEWIAIVSSRSE